MIGLNYGFSVNIFRDQFCTQDTIAGLFGQQIRFEFYVQAGNNPPENNPPGN